MNDQLNETHAPDARSWVQSANSPETDFPIQNLPFGVFESAKGVPRIGVAIGDQVVDLAAIAEVGLLPCVDEITCEAVMEPTLNLLMALGAERWHALRCTIFNLLREGADARKEVEQHLVPMSGLRMRVPAQIGDYTDFYASIYHARNVGALYRPDNPLLPNYEWVPIAYHGRASSVVISGKSIRRPHGQTKPDKTAAPVFGPSRSLDYELELGVFIGPGNEEGTSIPVADAAQHAFGICLVNDWSARDIQAWEYQPLGPFLAKNFTTTVSPWIITMEALAPYRVPAFCRASGSPQPLPYLADPADQNSGGFDIWLEVLLSTRKMREQHISPHRLSHGNFRDMYWTIAQMIAHHSSNGCNLRPADLLASGTISGDSPDSRGSLMEITTGGKTPLTLPTGETRTFLEEQDEIILRGYCQRENAARIGLGECSGTILD